MCACVRSLSLSPTPPSLPALSPSPVSGLELLSPSRLLEEVVAGRNESERFHPSRKKMTNNDAYAEDVEAIYRDKIHKQAPKYEPVVMRADVSSSSVFEVVVCLKLSRV